MKISGSKKKKGVSAVVATILIVMITVLAIGIIWVTILPMIRENLAVSDVCENAGVSIVSSQGYTCYKPSNITMVQVSKGNSDINVTGLKFSISSSGNSYEYDEQEVAYSTADYNVYYLNTSEFEKIEKISVVPTVKLGDSEKSCSVISLDNIPLCSGSVNLGEVSFGKLISRSGSGFNGVGGEVPITGKTIISISTCQDLKNVSNNLFGNYNLINNLDCSAENNLIIGNYSDNKCFNGDFNGKNFNITLSSISLEEDGVGLFSCSSGNISNLGVIGSYTSIVGIDYVGSLVGFNSGHVTDSFFASSESTIYANNYVGGLVGYNSGLINNSYVSFIDDWNEYPSYIKTVEDGEGAGGLAGYNSGEITSSYASMFGDNSIYSSNITGGFVGYNHASGKIRDSYSIISSIVFFKTYGGGFVGFNEGEISNSFSSANVWDSEFTIEGSFAGFSTKDITSSYWEIWFGYEAVNYGVIGKTVFKMKNDTLDFISSGWSQSIWKFKEGYYPRLIWEGDFPTHCVGKAVGDFCEDPGAVYAGSLGNYNLVILFNDSGSSIFGNSVLSWDSNCNPISLDSCVNDTLAGSLTDGYANTYAFNGWPDYQALGDVKNYMGFYGFPYWYLPSKTELELLFTNEALLEHMNLNRIYWSSTNFNITHAYACNITSCFPQPKNSYLAVRPMARY